MKNRRSQCGVTSLVRRTIDHFFFFFYFLFHITIHEIVTRNVLNLFNTRILQTITNIRVRTAFHITVTIYYYYYYYYTPRVYYTDLNHRCCCCCCCCRRCRHPSPLSQPRRRDIGKSYSPHYTHVSYIYV
jgi:hypothetical protein